MSMQIFVTALEAVLPIVLLILLGCFLRIRGFLSDGFLSVGSKVVFRLCLPVIHFIKGKKPFLNFLCKFFSFCRF